MPEDTNTAMQQFPGDPVDDHGPPSIGLDDDYSSSVQARLVAVRSAASAHRPGAFQGSSFDGGLTSVLHLRLRLPPRR